MLDLFDDNVALFDDVLKDFLAFRKTDIHRGSLIEKRIVDAEDGKAKVEHAKQAVKTIVDQRISGLSLPYVVVNLLREGWSQVMVLIHLRDGTESESWHHSVRVMDELLWSALPFEQLGDRLQLAKRVPKLLADLREGLSNIGYNLSDMNKIFDDLEDVHIGRMKKQSIDEPQDKQTHPDTHAKLPEPEVEIVMTADSLLDEIENLPEEPLDEAMLKKTDALRVGNWVEFHYENENPIRCRLAAIIQANGKYIFVNRLGRKVAERSQKELAYNLQDDELIILEDGLLFERALNSVIGNLRNMKNQQAAVAV